MARGFARCDGLVVVFLSAMGVRWVFFDFFDTHSSSFFKLLLFFFFFGGGCGVFLRRFFAAFAELLLCVVVVVGCAVRLADPSRGFERRK